MLPSSTNLPTATNCKESSRLNTSYIPDDILLNCFARVSRFYYPTLSLVSKRFRSLLASLELYKTRTLLSRTETCLYVHLCLGDGKDGWFTLCRRPTRLPNAKPQWFTLCFRPSRILTSDNILVSVPSRNFSPCFCQTLTAIGSSIYLIGGYINNKLSSRVFFMDCRSHTWHEAPSMQIVPNNPRASVIDGKIYVVEGSSKDVGSSKYLIEVFDPKTQTWELVESPGAEIRGTYISNSLVIKGNIYFFGDKTLVYKPNENIWGVVGLEMNLLAMNIWLATISDGYCEIDNVLYCYRFKKVLEWYDYEKGAWIVLKGLEELPKLPTGKNRVRLMKYGAGKIVVFWDKNFHAFSSKKMIWCAEIALERRNKHEIYGTVEWCDVVFTVPRSSWQLISATV